jgi:5-(carboxyamino)imidazole ribonucleotide synthase
MKVGVIGGGQLGRMMALEGYPLGFSFRFYDPSHESPGGQVAERFNSAFEDPQALDRFASGLDLATYEFENLPLSAAQRVASRVSYFFPPIKALQIVQDRLTQKNLFRRLNISTTPFERVDSLQDLAGAVSRLGFPAVLKTRRMGYDGKGQALLREPKDVEKGWMALGGTPLILEGFIAFEREISLIAVRGRHGRTAFYSMAQNTHHQGILRASIAPAPDLKPEIEAQAQAAAQAIFVELDYVGVLAIEFFLLQGRLIANEMAARVHNSGHWTLDGAAASQFENHLRAGAGLPLGSTAARGVTAMLNFIGELPSPEEVLRIPGAHLHLYGKLPRAGRKLGHANLCAATHEELRPLLAMASGLAGIRL